jgi:lipopolysaccharide/colanic/teichoic acid biosynthesis glycosyltransferase
MSAPTAGNIALDSNRFSDDTFDKIPVEFHGKEVVVGFGRPNEAEATTLLLNTPVIESRSYAVGKRIIDIIGASFAMIVGFPVYLTVAILVKATSRGPVLFRQKRLGLRGKQFWCYKFRTMVVDAEDVLNKNAALRAQFEREGFKIKDDPRITPIGAILRKLSLDELPQFMNVLLGDMSLIGPRPIVPKEITKYGIYGDRLLQVKPGLGGLWQASGRSDVDYDERIGLDMQYINERSLWLDTQLLLKTLTSVFRSRGAY